MGYLALFILHLLGQVLAHFAKSSLQGEWSNPTLSLEATEGPSKTPEGFNRKSHGKTVVRYRATKFGAPGEARSSFGRHL